MSPTSAILAFVSLALLAFLVAGRRDESEDARVRHDGGDEEELTPTRSSPAAWS
jgi:hypothetical protein